MTERAQVDRERQILSTAGEVLGSSLDYAATQVAIAEDNLDKTIAKAHRAGATYKQIGEILECSQGHAAVRARRSGIDPEPPSDQGSILDQPLP